MWVSGFVDLVRLISLGSVYVCVVLSVVGVDIDVSVGDVGSV